jgi:hypothetical protein
MTTYNEALDKYYKLKTNYETEYDKDKKSLINNTSLSWKEKRNSFHKLKPKCVNCKRAVGTNFSSKYNNKNEARILLAICGDKVHPCNLNINLNVGNFESLQNIIKNEEIYIKGIKDEIIKIKNSLLFGYITTETMLDNFNSQKESINNSISILENYLLKYLDITDNKQIKEQMNKNIEETYILINSIKESMKQFDLTSNNQFVKDSVNIYITQLIPKINNINQNLYHDRYVDYNDSTNTYHLINNKYSIQQLEYDLVTPKINSYSFGMITQKTQKNKVGIISKSKTQKNKKQLLIIEDSPPSSK